MSRRRAACWSTIRLTMCAPAWTRPCPGTKRGCSGLPRNGKWNSSMSTMFPEVSGRGPVRRAFGACLLAIGLALAPYAAADGATSYTDDAPSLVARALAYEHGEGVAKDQIRAAALYCQAARGGDAEAQFNSG